MSRYLNLASIKSWFSDQYQKRPYVILGVGAAIALLIVFLVAMAAIGGLTPSTAAQRSAAPSTDIPVVLATPTVIATITQAFIPTSTPIPSDIWEVSEILGKKNINGYNALVVVFRNVVSGETKQAQCQSPRDPAPKVGDTYQYLNTYSSIWLYVPYDNVAKRVLVESKLQRFAPIQ